MIKNAIFLSCDAGIALVCEVENFVKVLNFDKVQATVCHSNEGGISAISSVQNSCQSL